MPRPKRLTQEEIIRALGKAGVAEESERQELARKLYENLAENRGRIGRPPEKDEKELLAVARLVRKGTNVHAAARQVTAHLPESKREATHQRLYRKFRKDSATWLSKAATRPTTPTIQEEIERLRELLGPTAGSLDFRQLILRALEKDT